MPTGPLTSDQTLVAVAAGVLFAGLVGWGLYSYRKNKPTPEAIERGRRLMLNSIGKMGDGNIIELNGTSAIYSYDVRGVEYTASQELAALNQHLPPDLWAIVGPVSVKYDPRNPANSIVLCETWTGLRKI